MSETTEKYKDESEQLAVALFRVETLGQIEKCLTEENASLTTTIESQTWDMSLRDKAIAEQMEELEGVREDLSQTEDQLTEAKALIESQKEEIEKLRSKLDAKLTFVNTGSEDLRWAIQERQDSIIESLQKEKQLQHDTISEAIAKWETMQMDDDPVNVIESILSTLRIGHYVAFQEGETHE